MKIILNLHFSYPVCLQMNQVVIRMMGQHCRSQQPWLVDWTRPIQNLFLYQQRVKVNSRFGKSSRTIIVVTSRFVVLLSLMTTMFLSRTEGQRDPVTSGPHPASDLHGN